MTLEERAKAIADEADECCNRGDDWWQEIYDLALRHLKEAVEAGPA